jgi:glycosyltransferase involved in cell wall biosynthesis
MGEPFRILVVIDKLDCGGAEQALSNFATLTHRPDCQVHIACLGRKIERDLGFDEAGVETTVLNMGRWNPFAAGRLMRLVRSFRPHVLSCWLNKSAMVGAAVARKAGIPFVYHERDQGTKDEIHAVSHLSLLTKLLIRQKRKALASAQAVIACGGGAAEDLLALNMADKNRLSVIRNSVDLSRFNWDSEQAIEMRRCARTALHISHGAVVLANFSRFHQQKNWPAFFRAVQAARYRHQGIRALAVGKGPLLEEMKRMAQDIGLGDVVLFPGYRSDVPELMLASDILLFPSLREGDSNTVKQAMACGLPVVGYAAGDTAVAVRSGQDGFICDVGDENSLIANLLRVAEDPALRQALSHSARARAFAEFGGDKTARGIEKVLRDVVEQYATLTKGSE